MKIRITGKIDKYQTTGQVTPSGQPVMYNKVTLKPGQSYTDPVTKKVTTYEQALKKINDIENENIRTQATLAAIKKQDDAERAGDLADYNRHESIKLSSLPPVNTSNTQQQLANTLTRLPDQQLMMSLNKVPDQQLANTLTKVPDQEFPKVDLSGFKPPVVRGYQSPELEPVESQSSKDRRQQAREESKAKRAEKAFRRKYPNAPINATTYPGLEDQVAQMADPLGYEMDNRVPTPKPVPIDLTAPPMGAFTPNGSFTSAFDTPYTTNGLGQPAMAMPNLSANMYPILPQPGTPVTGSVPIVNPNAKPVVKPTFGARLNNSLIKGAQNLQKNKTYNAISNTGADIYNIAQAASPLVGYIDNKRKTAQAERAARLGNLPDNLYVPEVGNDRGDYTQWGEFRPNEKVVNKGMYTNQFEFGGNMINDKVMKIRIVGGPKQMAYGGQTDRGFALDLKTTNANMSSTPTESVTSSMSEQANPNSPIKLEAENGETVWNNDTHNILRGKSHAKGGIKLTEQQVQDGAFIFSKKLKEKDPTTLEMFGQKFKKGGTSYSDIAKKFELNKFKAILEDPYADRTSKNTAQMMMEKNKKSLAMLALAQEASKGFPQGPPVQSQPYLPQDVPMAAYGGYVPEYQGGGEDDIFDKDLQKVLVDLVKNKQYKLGLSPRMMAGDNKVPLIQGKQASGLYGDIKTNEIDEFKKRHAWYFKDKPNWKENKEDDVLDFQTKYDEEFSKQKGYSYFSGKRKFDKKDKKLGEYTYNAPGLDKKEDEIVKSKPKYKCKLNDNGSTVAVLSTDGTGYDTETEALTHCPTKEEVKPRYICLPDGSIMETKGSGIGYATEEEAAKNCGSKQKKVPYDFLLPDKVNMAAVMAQPINKYFPFYADTNPRVPRPTFFDPNRELAENASTRSMLTAGLNMLDPQSFSTRASAIQAQGAEQAANTIGTNQNRNVGVANEFSKLQSSILNRADENRAKNANLRWQGNAVVNQQYDNAIGAKLNKYAKAYSKAWNNRSTLGDLNDTMGYFYKDPTSGKNVFKGSLANNVGSLGAYGNPTGGVGTNGAGIADLGSAYNNLYESYLTQLDGNSNLSKEQKQNQADKLANMALNSMRSTYSNNPNDPFGSSRQRRTQFNLDTE